MYRIKTLNAIAPCGLDRMPADLFACGSDIELADAAGVLVRSAAMHDLELPDSLLAIARAGAGTNNIPVDKCSEKGIVVFNTPGANANGVKELVLAALLCASRNIVPAVEWARTLKGRGAEVPKLVESGKKSFVGPEIKGKRLGVIGLGAIGVMVANSAHHLEMEVLGFDPYLSVDSAWGLSRFVEKAASMDEIFSRCDYITVHVPLNDSTRGMLNEHAFSLMKKDVILLNFARGELVDVPALHAAIDNGTVATYVTDFPSEEILELPNVLAIPHLGASTPESEDNCAVAAAEELADYLLHGNILHSVNLPTLIVPWAGHTRICVIHKNIPNMLSQISSAMSAKNINIETMVNKSKKDYAYTVLDVSEAPGDDIVGYFESLPGIIRARVIRP